jgi:hypothetical protein
MPAERPRSTSPGPKRPYHVGVAVGLTTSVYAVSLLATTSMQIETDRALIEDRAPVRAAIDTLDSHHDLQEARLLQARLRYEDGAEGYEALAERLAALEERLRAVSRRVGSVERLGNSIPGSLTSGSWSQTSVGSGGGSGGSGGGGSGGGHSSVKLPPAPAPKSTPPPSSGGTGGSGKP